MYSLKKRRLLFTSINFAALGNILNLQWFSLFHYDWGQQNIISKAKYKHLWYMKKWEWVALNLIKLRVCGGGEGLHQVLRERKRSKRHQLSDRTPKEYINYLQASPPQRDFQSWWDWRLVLLKSFQHAPPWTFS